MNCSEFAFCQFACRSLLLFLLSAIAPKIKVRSRAKSNWAISKSDAPSSAKYISCLFEVVVAGHPGDGDEGAELEGAEVQWPVPHQLHLLQWGVIHQTFSMHLIEAAIHQGKLPVSLVCNMIEFYLLLSGLLGISWEGGCWIHILNFLLTDCCSAK